MAETRSSENLLPETDPPLPPEEVGAASRPGRGWHGNSEGHAVAGRKGGRIAHERGTAHRFTAEEARQAGRKGGRAAHQHGTAHEFTPQEARDASRRRTVTG